MAETFAEKQSRIAEELSNLIEEAYPSADTSNGTVLYDLLVKPASLYFANQDTYLETVRDNYSISQVLASDNPDDTLVDNLLSNYNISRRQGSPATGTINIYTSTNTNLYIPSNTIFTCGGVQISPIKSYVGIASGSALEDTSTVSYVPLVELSDGKKVLAIQAQTVENFSSSLSAGLSCTSTLNDSAISSIEIGSSFSAGSVEETNSDLLSRAKLGVNAKVLTGRDNIKAFLIENENLNVQDAAIFGMGDALQTRDALNNGGISSGGRVDIYIRNSAIPTTYDATLTGTKNSDGYWEIPIPSSAYAGAYGVTHITYGNSTINTNIEHVLGSEATGGWPLINSADQARYSKYQTLTVRFQTDAVSSSLSEASFTVRIVYMEGVSDTQDYLNSDSVRSISFDHLVKAVIPVIIEIDVDIQYPSGSTVPAAEDIKKGISDTINRKSIGQESLYTSDVSIACNSIFPEGTVKTPINLRASIFMPNGTLAYTSSQSYIKAPTAPGISYKNCKFFSYPSDINLVLSEVGR